MAASQFLVQWGVGEPEDPGHEFVLTVGYLHPPLHLGDASQDSVAEVHVQPLARFSLPRSRMIELAELIQKMTKPSEGGEGS
jgi:hypothetical protein